MVKTMLENITDVFTNGGLDDLGVRLNDIKRQIEKTLITNVYAPHALQKRDSIKSKSKQEISKIAKEGESALQGVNDTLDSAIKGQWSTAVREAITESSNKYNKI
ncbi:hypothetical protein STRDD11_02303 [Streptococcus sp. DD11]|uniref:hypothetical protein n=1 Tax=Streptococcus sp. DD11 TaxID=1777879 RepID=UPI000796769F|nr:hypothetical protein [Streptococcus sp. DD11]KXT79356.1 hypothetical protein STRDD11_02303 [Streptococcus sp. DD11]